MEDFSTYNSDDLEEELEDRGMVVVSKTVWEQRDTLYLKVKEEVRARRAQVEGMEEEEACRSLDPEEICERQMHAVVADRLEALLEESGGDDR
jgi:hypothetical protein